MKMEEREQKGQHRRREKPHEKVGGGGGGGMRKEKEHQIEPIFMYWNSKMILSQKRDLSVPLTAKQRQARVRSQAQP